MTTCQLFVLTISAKKPVFLVFKPYFNLYTANSSAYHFYAGSHFEQYKYFLNVHFEKSISKKDKSTLHIVKKHNPTPIKIKRIS